MRFFVSWLTIFIRSFDKGVLLLIEIPFQIGSTLNKNGTELISLLVPHLHIRRGKFLGTEDT